MGGTTFDDGGAGALQAAQFQAAINVSSRAECKSRIRELKQHDPESSALSVLESRLTGQFGSPLLKLKLGAIDDVSALLSTIERQLRRELLDLQALLTSAKARHEGENIRIYEARETRAQERLRALGKCVRVLQNESHEILAAMNAE
jgi:hypothetical protein